MLKYVNYDIVFQEIPNETTLAINISNCPNLCEGCHSPELREDIGEPLTEKILSQLLNKYGSQITCICFMGGDSSPIEIEHLSHYIKENSTLKTAWYSGKPKLPISISLTNFHYIKLGSYQPQLGSLKSKTTNQKLYKINQENQLEDITYMFWN